MRRLKTVTIYLTQRVETSHGYEERVVPQCFKTDEFIGNIILMGVRELVRTLSPEEIAELREALLLELTRAPQRGDIELDPLTHLKVYGA